MELTPREWVGLGIYLGFKASYRREEMSYRGVDYDAVVAKLTQVGLIKNGRINKKAARAVWEEKFGKTLPSQVHQYMPGLGVTNLRFPENNG